MALTKRLFPQTVQAVPQVIENNPASAFMQHETFRGRRSLSVVVNLQRSFCTSCSSSSAMGLPGEETQCFFCSAGDVKPGMILDLLCPLNAGIAKTAAFTGSCTSES